MTDSPDTGKAAARSPRKRRSTAQVRSLITAAAYDEFVENGFDGTSIRAVAQRAGVTESMVFRHFSSKPALFEATAVGPLVQFMNEFATSIPARPDEDPGALTFRFISGLYDLCTANRHILVSLAAQDDGTPRAGEPVFDACARALVRGVETYMAEADQTATADILDAIRMVLALVLGATLSGNELFPAGAEPDRIKTMLSQFVLFGAGYRPSVRVIPSGS